jgi:hypothetical protein
MRLPSNLDSIPSLTEGRRIAALYFEEQRFGLRPHIVRAATPGDDGLVLLTGDGYAYLASEAIGNNALLVAPLNPSSTIAPGSYLGFTPNGLMPFDLARATPAQRDRIEEALASYRALQRPDAPLPPFAEYEQDEETLPLTTPLHSSTPSPFSPEDLAAIAQFEDDPDVGAMPSEHESTETSARIAVALSADQVSHLLHLDFPAETCTTKLEAVRQGRELVVVLDQRVVLDYSPSQERFIGLLHRDDKAFLDATLSAPSSLPTPHANSSVDWTRSHEELERDSR